MVWRQRCDIWLHCDQQIPRKTIQSSSGTWLLISWMHLFWPVFLFLLWSRESLKSLNNWKYEYSWHSAGWQKVQIFKIVSIEEKNGTTGRIVQILEKIWKIHCSFSSVSWTNLPWWKVLILTLPHLMFTAYQSKHSKIVYQLNYLVLNPFVVF